MQDYPKICEYCGKKDPGLWRRMVEKEKPVQWIHTNFAGIKYHKKFSRPPYNTPPDTRTYPFPPKNQRLFWFICPECMDKVKEEEKQLEDDSYQEYIRKKEWKHQSWMKVQGKKWLKDGPTLFESDRQIFLWLKNHEGQKVLFTDSNASPSIREEPITIPSPTIKKGDYFLTYKFSHSHLRIPEDRYSSVRISDSSMVISFRYTNSIQGDKDAEWSGFLEFKAENPEDGPSRNQEEKIFERRKDRS